MIEPCNNNSKIVHKKETAVEVVAKDKKDLALLKADLKNTNYIVLSNDCQKIRKDNRSRLSSWQKSQ